MKIKREMSKVLKHTVEQEKEIRDKDKKKIVKKV